MKISSKSLIMRFAYPGNQPKTVSFCTFIGRITLAFAAWIIILCMAAFLTCLLTAVIPIALMFGHRPCYIKFLRDPEVNSELFQKYELPEFLGWKLWPAIYIILIIFGYLLIRYISPEAYFIGTKHFFLGYIMVLMGMIGLALIIMENASSAMTVENLPKIRKAFAWWPAFKAKTCPVIEITND